MINKDFHNDGFLKEFSIEIGDTLKKLQERIYFLTKEFLVDHQKDLPIEKKISLPFKEIPNKKFWSDIMNNINDSSEFHNLVSSPSIVKSFKKIFNKPLKFDICTFRARIPNQSRVIYNWHQDEGTWYLSKNKNLQNKYSATLWFSVNGANKLNSIQLIKGSHKNKLLNHKYVEGQGYFSADGFDVKDCEIYTVNTKISEAVIFHPLLIHRSVINKHNKPDMYPRYSIDIRYYDENLKLNYNTSLNFKIKKFLEKWK
tara:strand:+ start:2952 stop:3722 length:771 start_codon:yes stop_codon:yes gene_type:complete